MLDTSSTPGIYALLAATQGELPDVQQDVDVVDIGSKYEDPGVVNQSLVSTTLVILVPQQLLMQGNQELGAEKRRDANSASRKRCLVETTGA